MLPTSHCYLLHCPPAAATTTREAPEEFEDGATATAAPSEAPSSSQPGVVYSSAVSEEAPGSEAGVKTAPDSPPKPAGRGGNAIRGGDGALVAPDGVLLVGKESDVGVVARAIGWQVMKSVRSAKKNPTAGEPLMTLRAGYGASLLKACTALAMVQPRLLHEMGFRVVVLPAVKVRRCGACSHTGTCTVRPPCRHHYHRCPTAPSTHARACAPPCCAERPRGPPHVHCGGVGALPRRRRAVPRQERSVGGSAVAAAWMLRTAARSR